MLVLSARRENGLVLNAGPAKIFGIVNITEDSFSDGGLYLRPERAIERAREHRRAGAFAVDIGAASSHPDAERVSLEEEIRRLASVIPSLTKEGISVSVDSYHPEVQRFAMESGADFLNDIQGFSERSIYPVLAAYGGRLIVMHSIQRNGPADRTESDPQGIMDVIFRFFDDRIESMTGAGIDANRLILDPGMGFFLGTDPIVSVRVLQNIRAIKERFGLPVLVSVSRKSFLGNLTGRSVSERGPSTLTAELFAVDGGADYIRTHDTAALRDALLIQNILRKDP